MYCVFSLYFAISQNPISQTPKNDCILKFCTCTISNYEEYKLQTIAKYKTGTKILKCTI